MIKIYFVAAVVCTLLFVSKDTAHACDFPPCDVPPNKEVFAIYVPGLFALSVEQQPSGDTGYVTEEPLKATQFQWTDKGVIGLLAHSQYSGKEFSEIQVGHLVKLYKGDGSIDIYLVRSIHNFQKYGLGNSSTYRDLETDDIYTTYEMHEMFYRGENHLTLQTCIEKHDDPLWGLRFVVAEPFVSLPQLGLIKIRRW